MIKDDCKEQLYQSIRLEWGQDTQATPLSNDVEVPALLTASFMAIDPSWGAFNAARELWKEPIGVLTALTMTTSCKLETIHIYHIHTDQKYCRLQGYRQ